MNVLLVGDIGGTKTELAVFSPVTALSTPLAHATFPSARYAGIAEMVHAFLTGFNVQIDRVCLGVAGPVVADQATISNLSWVISAAQLKDEFKLRSVIMMNDLEAMANAVPFLQRQDLHPRRILPFLDKEFFLQALLQKGRLSNMLMQIPVYVILHPHVALYERRRIIAPG